MQTQVVGQELGTAIRELIPPELVPVFVAVTYLGDAGVLFALFIADYWFGDRRRGAHGLGVLLAGMGLIYTLKNGFALPRPSDSIAAVTIDGYSFPSGHAMQSTIGYSLLAYTLDVGTRRLRYAVAAVLITLVSLSRVVIGVHYVRDVTAGVIVALLFVAGALYVTDDEPSTAFWLAGAFSLAALAVTGANQSGLAVFGGAVGALLAWRAFDSVPVIETNLSRALLTAVVLPVLGVLAYFATELDPPLLVVAPVVAVVLAGVLVAPILVHRVTPNAS
ncbi:phosphatase PAP2 family protein [Halogeometricum limi]|uniref:PAP2 superfamily protein n=1 Tax=Halogeometricum limi TaxID=555875 RepID=A0A1I6HFP0_9EURY|nr:phosphatase PAP2 family protein [Halogeometricum limi]SFR53160.1 PAP2 superfamily protein [Halogeometricum limi]